MAQGIGGGNYFAQVNAQFAKDMAKGDGAASQSLRNASGTTAQARKGSVAKNEVAGGEDSGGIVLSDKAQQALKSAQDQHGEILEDHGHEMAQQAGVHDTSHETADARMQRGYERTQEELGEKQLPHGMVRVESAEGVEQVVTVKQAEHLEQMDDPDITDDRVLGEIPDANLNAANAVIESQMAQGVSKVAQLKTDPKIDEVAATMEVEPRPMMTEPMDIVGPGNDRLSQPMPVEFPPEMEQIAAEKAARDLSNGGGEQESFLAGAGAAAAAMGGVTAAAAGLAAARPAASAAGSNGVPTVDGNPAARPAGNAAQAAATSAPLRPEHGGGPAAQPGGAGPAASPRPSAAAKPAQPRLSPEQGGGPADGDTRFDNSFGGAPQPGFMNAPGRPQEPVPPTFLQRLKYLFTGGQPPVMGGYPGGFYPTQAPPWGGPGPVGDPTSTLKTFSMMQNLQSVMAMGSIGMNDPMMGLMGIGMMLPGMFMNHQYINMMGQQPWQMPPMPMGPQPLQPGMMHPGMMPPNGMQPGMMPPGMPPNGMTPPGMMQPGVAPAAQFMRYDPTPQRPGSVVVLDSFQPDPRFGGSAPGELAHFASSPINTVVARCELAPPPAPGTPWHSQVMNAPPEALRGQMLQDLANNRMRQLQGATMNLDGLAKEGLKNSAVTLPAGSSPAGEVWGTYAGLRQAWTQPSNNQGSQIALTNYCNAFGLDSSRIMHADARVAEPERARLQQALARLSAEVDGNPQVKQAQAGFDAAAFRLAHNNKVSVVTAAPTEDATTGTTRDQALQIMADDRGDKDGARPLQTDPNFNRGIFSTQHTVSVGASLADDQGKPMSAGRVGANDGLAVLADSNVRLNDGTQTARYGSAAAAPKVARALAALHAAYPDKSTAEIQTMLREQATEPTRDGAPGALSDARLEKLIADKPRPPEPPRDPNRYDPEPGDDLKTQSAGRLRAALFNGSSGSPSDLEKQAGPFFGDAETIGARTQVYQSALESAAAPVAPGQQRSGPSHWDVRAASERDWSQQLAALPEDTQKQIRSRATELTSEDRARYSYSDTSPWDRPGFRNLKRSQHTAGALREFAARQDNGLQPHQKLAIESSTSVFQKADDAFSRNYTGWHEEFER